MVGVQGFGDAELLFAFGIASLRVRAGVLLNWCLCWCLKREGVESAVDR